MSTDSRFHWWNVAYFFLMTPGPLMAFKVPGTAFDVIGGLWVAGGVFAIFFNGRGYNKSVEIAEPKHSEQELREIGNKAWEDKQPKEAKPKVFVDGKEQIYAFATVKPNLIRRDERWQQFGLAVVNGMPMTQAKWTGKGRPFSKPEFSGQMNGWLSDGIVKYKNPKNHKDGFTPRGGAGHKYFCDLAKGNKWISLPYSEKQ